MSNEEVIAANKAALDKAVEHQQATKKVLDDLKASGESVVKAYEDAKTALNNLKPALNVARAQLQRADADVTIAREAYIAVAPKEAVVGRQGTGNAKLLDAVTAILKDKPNGLTNGEIFDALRSAGVEMAAEKARDNLNAYLSRWGSAGSLVSKGTGKWGVQAPAAPPLPSFLVPTAPVVGGEAPAGGVDESVKVADAALTPDFPGYEPLVAAGFQTQADLSGKTVEDLTSIAGIGAKTAAKILEALAA